MRGSVYGRDYQTSAGVTENQTNAEALIWERVRNRKLGIKVVRQKPILLKYFHKMHAFIADFYCNEAKLVIEIDGIVHDRQIEYDKLRSMLLEQKGLHTVRFSNEEVYHDIEEVIKKLMMEIEAQLSRSPHSPRPPLYK